MAFIFTTLSSLRVIQCFIIYLFRNCGTLRECITGITRHYIFTIGFLLSPTN